MTALYVAFRVGSAEFVLPTSDVLNLEAYEERSTEVPGTAGWVQGLVQVRGRVLPLLDLRRRFGLPPATADELRSARIIVVQEGERIVGLLTDSAREVLRLDPAGFAAPPEVIRENAESFVRSIALHQNRMLMLLDLSKVLGDQGHVEQR